MSFFTFGSDPKKNNQSNIQRPPGPSQAQFPPASSSSSARAAPAAVTVTSPAGKSTSTPSAGASSMAAAIPTGGGKLFGADSLANSAPPISSNMFGLVKS